MPKGKIKDDLQYLNQDMELDAVAFSYYLTQELQQKVKPIEPIKEKVLSRVKELEKELEYMIKI